MAMTNAERQAAWRNRMREKMATANFALEAADSGDPLHEIVRLKKDLAKEKERNKELRGQLKVRDAMESIDAKSAQHHANRAMYAEADKERLQAEVDRLTEENDRLRAAPLCNEQAPSIDHDLDGDEDWKTYHNRSLDERIQISVRAGYRDAIRDHMDHPGIDEPLPDMTNSFNVMAMAEKFGMHIAEYRISSPQRAA